MTNMNVDKAYLLGLIIGGGVFGKNDNSFHIRLPYKRWGSVEKNPARAGKIAKDILNVVSPMMRGIYGIDATYEATDKEWNIQCYGDLSKLKNDLVSYGIFPSGDLRKNVSIGGVVSDLIDENMKRRFIAGLADTIGSTAKSHRRFSDNTQTISFEISGFRYDFVCQLCQLLCSIKCYPDQVLWNHPNFHSANDRYYKPWNKGFKLRVLLDQYDKFGAFAFKAKVESVSENRNLQTYSNKISPTCVNRPINVGKSCVHIDEDSDLLPPIIRNGHYLHNLHVCCVLGCEHAPYDKMEEVLNDAGKYINPFPILHKDSIENIQNLLESEPIYSNRTFAVEKANVSYIYHLYQKSKHKLVYGTDETNGYPVNILVQALAYAIAGKNGKLHGKRISGNQDEHITSYLKSNNKFDIILRIPEIPTVLIVECGEWSAMVGAENPNLYSKLISRDSNNKFKLIVRDITEEDLHEYFG